MSENDPTRTPTPLKGVLIEPPREVEAVPPPVSNFVTVRGGADCAILDFYYVPPRRWAEIEAARLSGETTVIERHDDVGVARMQPVARVSLPFFAAAELVTSLVEMAASSARDMREDGPSLLARLAEATRSVQEDEASVNAPEEAK